MRCDKCKHWSETSEDWYADQVGMRECHAARPREEITDEATDALYKSITVVEGEQRIKTPHGEVYLYDSRAREMFDRARCEALRDARAFVKGGEPHSPELWTAADFFCALFSPKPEIKS